MKRPGGAALSIGVKLPLLFTVLLGSVLILFSWLTHGQLRGLAISGAGERAERFARQLAVAAEGSVRARREEMQRLAELPAVTDFLRAGRRSASGELRALLAERVAIDEQVSAFAITAADGEPLLEMGEISQAGPWQPPVGLLSEPRGPRAGGGGQAPAAAGGEASDAGSAAVIGPMRRSGDSIYYEVWWRVTDAERLLGLLGQRRSVPMSPATRDLVLALVGLESARVSYGNGDVWTDLATVIEPPAPLLAMLAGFRSPGIGPSVLRFEFDRPNSGGSIAAAASVPSTPWLLVVELSRETVLAPVRGTTWRMAGLATLLLGLGYLGAWGAGRRITAPVRRIIAATRSIDDLGDLEEARRTDEIGRLAQAFRKMGREVSGTRAGLEDEIRARTAELRRAVQTLQETRDELLRRERMTMLGELSAAVSHELRNCLGVIRNAAFVIAHSEKGRSAVVDEQLEVLGRQLELSERIIQDLLETGTAEPPARQAVSVRSLVESQLERVEIPPTIRVRRHFPEALREADVDPLQVGQAVYNLILNGIQAMGSGGTLRLAARQHDARTLELTIADSGPGIGADVIERIFEPLYTTKVGGTGLGLSVSRALVRVNGGDITAHNDDGAVFTVVLPTVLSRSRDSAPRPTGGRAGTS